MTTAFGKGAHGKRSTAVREGGSGLGSPSSELGIVVAAAPPEQTKEQTKLMAGSRKLCSHISHSRFMKVLFFRVGKAAGGLAE